MPPMLLTTPPSHRGNASYPPRCRPDSASNSIALRGGELGGRTDPRSMRNVRGRGKIFIPANETRNRFFVDLNHRLLCLNLRLPPSAITGAGRG